MTYLGPSVNFDGFGMMLQSCLQSYRHALPKIFLRYYEAVAETTNGSSTKTSQIGNMAQRYVRHFCIKLQSNTDTERYNFITVLPTVVTQVVAST